MNPYNAAHNLARALRESAEFKEMKDATSALKDDQSAKQMVMDLRNQQIELQKQKQSGIQVSKEQEEKMEKLLEVVNMNLTAKRFLQAEYKMAVLLQDIQNIIGDATSEIYDPELMGQQDDDGEQQA